MSSAVIHTVLDLFPPPRYLAMPSVGIDISETSVKFLELRYGRGGRFVASYGEYKLPPDAIVRGTIQNQAPIIDALKRLREEHGARFAYISLPEEKAYLFQTPVPQNAQQAEVHSLIEFRLEENVPIAPAEAVFDYEFSLEPSVSGKRNVSVSVFGRATVEQYYSLFVASGITPLSFEIEAQAITRSVVTEGDDGTYLLVDFGRARTGLAVVSQGVLMLTSTLEIGGDAMTSAIQKQFGVSELEAERIKDERGIVRSAHTQEAYEALVATLSAISEEIGRYLAYWHDRAPGAPAIERVLVCGGNANIQGFPEYLAQTLHTPVERANVWRNVFSLDEVVPPINRTDSYGYATAVGLALRAV